MALTEAMDQDLSELRSLFYDHDGMEFLTEWEQNFTMEKLQQKNIWGDKLRLSEREWTKIEEILEKLRKATY